jgi:hypothetical protein
MIVIYDKILRRIERQQGDKFTKRVSTKFREFV